VRAAGVVADHPAERAAVVRGRVRAERQPVRPGRSAQLVEDQTGLDAGGARLRVDLQHPVQVLGEVQDDRGVHRLAGDRGAGAAGQHRHVVLPADGDRGLDVVGVARGDVPDRHPPVVRRVRGVHRPGAAVEPHRAAHRRP
jgi:hypothetical protein